MSSFDRKTELIRKKAKLAAMREERLKKEEGQLNISPQNANKFDPSASGDAISVDTILQELGMTDHAEKYKQMLTEDLGKSNSSPAFLTQY